MDEENNMRDSIKAEREFWDDFWGKNKYGFGGMTKAEWNKHTADVLALIEPAMKGSVGSRKKARVLELGVGIGRLAIPLAKKLGESVTVVGVDISEAALGEALVAADKAGVKNFEAFLGDGRAIPEEVGRIHGAYCFVLFQQLPWAAVRSYLKQVSDLLIKGCFFRFQFVEGSEESSFLSNYFRFEDIERELAESTGLQIVDVDRGALHPRWTWISCRKG